MGLPRFFRGAERDETADALKEILPAACLIYVTQRPHSGLIYLYPKSSQFSARLGGLPSAIEQTIRDENKANVFVYSPPSSPSAYAFLVGADALRLRDVKDLASYSPSSLHTSADPLAVMLSAYAFKGERPVTNELSSTFGDTFARLVPGDTSFEYRYKRPKRNDSPLVLLCVGNEDFQKQVAGLPTEGLGRTTLSSRLKEGITRQGLEPLLQASAASFPSAVEAYEPRRESAALAER